MTQQNFTKISSPAIVFCQDIELTDEAKQLLTRGLTAAQYLQLLIADELHTDAVRFLARALPKRESTWWACLAARRRLQNNPHLNYWQALESAERWVYKPSEENRRLCMASAEAAGFDHPASWAAVAAFWSGDSLGPVDAPPLPPANNLTGKAVSGAVMLAAVQTEPEKAGEKYRHFLGQGIDIACGGDGRSASAP
ncbi:MAG: hypothetical protein NTX45_29755 [Proteobacteria bacterium]|nr:hypothetical protein [Pseudomonadota bacterium]